MVINRALNTLKILRQKEVNEGRDSDKVDIQLRRLHPDERFLKKTMDEFRVLKYPKKSSRYGTIGIIQRYFRHLKLPSAQDAHFFKDEVQARHFINCSRPITAPVFVENGCNFSVIDPKSDKRPIEQLLELLPNPAEQLDCEDEELPDDADRITTSVEEVKRRFQASNGFTEYPRNFPDIQNTFPDRSVPYFVKSPNCLMLHDIVRQQFDTSSYKDICTCPDARQHGLSNCKERHGVLKRELIALRDSWNFWQGTCMLAEAGAHSLPHWDRYSFGTWISCVEGEIGYAWLSQPAIEEQTDWLRDTTKPTGRWLFKILRSGNCLYMSPGTVHLVFRRPHGFQTMGFAGHVVRRTDALEWLRTLHTEVKFAAQDPDNETPFGDILPPLLRGVRDLFQNARRCGVEEKYGGSGEIREGIAMIAKIAGQAAEFKRYDQVA